MTTATAVRHDRPVTTSGLTYTEIAERYEVSHGTVVNNWVKHPDWPPALPEKRGRALQFDPAKVEALVRAEFRPEPVPAGDELLTLKELYPIIVERVSARGAIPPAWETVQAYERGHRLPEAVGRRLGVKLYRRDAFERYLADEYRPRKRH